MNADDYVRDVSRALRDLPWKQRRDLVAELRAHLGEQPPGANEIEAPELYAANLREAAGLERRRGMVAYLRARRPRNLALTAIALIVVALAIGTFAWIQNYQPLVYGGAFELPGGTKSTLGVNGDAIPVRPGQRFDIGLEVENSGHFTVRIVSIPLDMTALPFHGRVLMHGPVYHRGINRNTPFHPFDLQPGQGFWLQINGTFDCGTLVQDDVLPFAIPVRYTFLWRTSTAALAPDEPVVFTVPHASNCPMRR